VLEVKKMIGSRVKSLVFAAVLGLVSASAQAVVVDGWQLNTNAAGIASNNVNIGHLNLSGGSATVQQEINGGGTPFVGAEFREFGQIFSISYTGENVPGANDFGFPQLFAGGLGLRIVFDGLAGNITSFNAGTGAVTYSFAAGVGDVFLQGSTDGFATFVNLAEFEMSSPSGGDLNDFFGAAQTNLAAGYTPGLFKDSLGVAFNPEFLLVDIETNNTIGAPASAPGICAFDATKTCVSLLINSDGSLDLLTVPEPGMLGLLGIAIAGLGFVGRRKSAA
jgi:hypothetical protein